MPVSQPKTHNNIYILTQTGILFTIVVLEPVMAVIFCKKGGLKRAPCSAADDVAVGLKIRNKTKYS